MFLTRKALRAECDSLFAVFSRKNDEVTKELNEEKRSLQELFLVIQSLRDEIHSFAKQLNLQTDDKPSSRAVNYQQKLADYQKKMDALAGSVVESAPADPPSLNAST